MFSSKTQQSTALSSCEAEYVSGSEISKEIMYIRNLLVDFNEIQLDSSPIYIDNQSAIKSALNEIDNKRLKHIDVKHHYIKELISNNYINIQYLQTDEMPADIFTKCLPNDKHYYLLNKFML